MSVDLIVDSIIQEYKTLVRVCPEKEPRLRNIVNQLKVLAYDLDVGCGVSRESDLFNLVSNEALGVVDETTVIHIFKYGLNPITNGRVYRALVKTNRGEALLFDVDPYPPRGGNYILRGWRGLTVMEAFSSFSSESILWSIGEYLGENIGRENVD